MKELIMKRIIYFSLMFGLLFSVTACGGDSDDEPNPEPPDPEVEMYTNPVFQPVLADPSLLDNRSRDGYFYAYGTQDNWGTTSATERYVPILRSSDLVTWEDMGDAFVGQPNWNFGENLYWAPDMEYINGKYYLYYSLSVWGATNPAIGVAIGDSPIGPFIDQGKILDSNESGVQNSIDQFVYAKSNGDLFLFWGSFRGIYAVPLEADGKTARMNEKFQIAGNAFEATYIYKKDGYYYFFGSVGSCCDGPSTSYHVTVARSESLEGPYFDRNDDNIMNAMDPIHYGKTPETRNVNALFEGRNIIGPGHNSEIVKDDEGTDWIIYHGIQKPNYNLPNGATKRPLFLDKITWDSEGWPSIGVSGTPSDFATEAPIIN